MRIERLSGSHIDTDSEVWGLDQTTWKLMGKLHSDVQQI